MPAPAIGDTGLTRWLQAVVWGAALIPLAVFVGAAWWGYERAFRDAEQSVLRANAVVARHADGTLDIATLLLGKARVMAGAPDAELVGNEEQVHQRLADVVSGVPAVLALSVWNASGQALVSSGPFPVEHDTSIADTAEFQSLKEGTQRLLVTGLVTGRLLKQPLFNLVTRRETTDGRFAGAISVSIAPDYFRDFYYSLATEEAGLNTFALYKDDGTLITRWPPPPAGMTRLAASSAMGGPASAGQKSGMVHGPSSIDGELRLGSFRRLDKLPLYVSTSLSERAILAGWRRFVILLAAVMVPITAGLVCVSYLALKKTRREQAMLQALQRETRRRSQIERALLQSQKLEALSQLTGGVAHDFNNLLAIVNGNLHLLKRRHPDAGKDREVTAITRAVASGVRLTRQLLSFSRKQALNPEVISLQQWLPGVESLLRTTLGSGIGLQVQVDAGAAPVRADTAELELALINLAVNAKDAMPQGGTLRIVVFNQPQANPAEAEVVISVSDTGTGISPELLAKVFEPFFTTKGPTKGTGLGLSQVHGFCVQAGGTATVASVVGQGTTVAMVLPAARDEAVARALAGTGAPETLRGRVLLVEDNEAVSDAYAQLLRASGLVVERAASADAGIAMVLDTRDDYDVVVSDVAMPGVIDGMQLALQLRTLRPDLPVILMTGYAARLHDVHEAGLRVLSKPVDPDTLFTEIQRAMADARQADITAGDGAATDVNA